MGVRRWVMGVVTAGALLVPAGAQADPYIALGDSYTAGSGSYASSLYATYQGTLGADAFVNLASGGATAGSIASSQVPTALSLINDNATDTKAVTVLAGGNDILSGGACSTTPDGGGCTLRTTLDSIFSQLGGALAADPGDEVFIGGMYPNPSSGTGSALEATRDRQLLGQNGVLQSSDTGADAGLNDIILKEATDEGATTANPYPAFKECGQAFISSDGLHPNTAGHAALAQVFRGEPVTCPAATTQPGADTTPPETAITGQPKSKTKKKKATFEFTSTEPGSTFECSLNGAPLTPCSSPITVKGKKGKNTFVVRARDAAGNVDATPATYTWKVKKKKRKK